MGFFQHHHLSFDRAAGQTEFRNKINTIFARNGIAFELHPVRPTTSEAKARGESIGEIRHLGPPIAGELLRSAVFSTGDTELDGMLETARTKFLDTDPVVRLESLEKLWDAWERLKTVLGPDKKVGTKALLDRASSEPNFRGILEEEARKLTDIGNSFQIRHAERNQTPLQESAHIDFLFHRLFSLIWLLLNPTN